MFVADSAAVANPVPTLMANSFLSVLSCCSHQQMVEETEGAAGVIMAYLITAVGKTQQCAVVISIKFCQEFGQAKASTGRCATVTVAASQASWVTNTSF